MPFPPPLAQARSADVAAVQGLALAKANDAAQTAPAGTRRIEWLDSLLFVILVACIAAAVAYFLT